MELLLRVFSRFRRFSKRNLSSRTRLSGLRNWLDVRRTGRSGLDGIGSDLKHFVGVNMFCLR